MNSKLGKTNLVQSWNEATLMITIMILLWVFFSTKLVCILAHHITQMARIHSHHRAATLVCPLVSHKYARSFQIWTAWGAEWCLFFLPENSIWHMTTWIDMSGEGPQGSDVLTRTLGLENLEGKLCGVKFGNYWCIRCMHKLFNIISFLRKIQCHLLCFF